MAISLRNILGGHSRANDPYESAAPQSSQGLAGTQPVGSLRGKEVLIPHDHLFEPYHWKQTLVSVGATSSTVVTAASATLPQHLVITSGSTNGDGVNLQYAAATDFSALTTYAAVTPFVCKTGFNIHLRARFLLVDDVSTVGLIVGLTPVDTALLSSGAIDQASFVGLYKATSSTNMVGTVRTASASTSSTLATIAADTWYDFEMVINGRAGVIFYLNGAKTYQGTVTNLPANTVPMTLSLAYQTMSSGAEVMKVQSLTCSQEAI